jgi:hypothetical protein
MSAVEEAVPPKGISWRSFVKEAFVKAGLSEGEASRWTSYLIEARKGLHGDCFYGLTYEEEHEPLMERAREYVDLVDKTLRKAERRHDELRAH